ncbi:MAG TPA: hypothetical protein PK539_00825 [Candidatus Paceibacterota bacterium]|nr:hypothetical protein [Candidatus Paceibacterota bacterium]
MRYATIGKSDPPMFTETGELWTGEYKNGEGVKWRHTASLVSGFEEEKQGRYDAGTDQQML